jgi:hypothetical protein
MNIEHALTIPLGLPPYLVLDQLHRGISPASILASEDSLLAEYRNADGYAYRWGNVIEARTPAWLAWHVAPVTLWSDTAALRRSSAQTAATLTPLLQHQVIGTLTEALPAGLMLAGCHPQSRRYPHVLFSLVLIDPDREREIRRWLANIFLERVLPNVLGRIRAEIIAVCRTHAVSD